MQTGKTYGVVRVTLHDLKKNEQKVVEYLNTIESGPEERKLFQSGKHFLHVVHASAF